MDAKFDSAVAVFICERSHRECSPFDHSGWYCNGIAVATRIRPIPYRKHRSREREAGFLLADFLHHGDKTIPPQQRFGGFARSHLAGLGVPVENRFGLHPAARPGGLTSTTLKPAGPSDAHRQAACGVCGAEDAGRLTNLPFQSLVMRQIGHVTDVMVGTDKNEMIGVREKLSNSLIRRPSHLGGCEVSQS